MHKAKHVVDLMLRKAKNFPRYQTASYFLMGKVYLQIGNRQQSQKMFNKAISLSKRWHFPQIQYLVLCDIARDSIQGKEEKEVKILVRKACRFIEKMADNIGDEILAAQFRESHFHEDLLHYCRQHDLLKRET